MRDLDVIANALTCLPSTCRYHGNDFERLGTEPYEAGLPRCDSCKPPWRRARGLDALARLRTELARLAQLDGVPELRRKH